MTQRNVNVPQAPTTLPTQSQTGAPTSQDERALEQAIAQASLPPADKWPLLNFSFQSGAAQTAANSPQMIDSATGLPSVFVDFVASLSDDQLRAAKQELDERWTEDAVAAAVSDAISNNIGALQSVALPADATEAQKAAFVSMVQSSIVPGLVEQLKQQVWPQLRAQKQALSLLVNNAMTERGLVEKAPLAGDSTTLPTWAWIVIGVVLLAILIALVVFAVRSARN